MNRTLRQLALTIRANISTLGQLVAGARKGTVGITDSVNPNNGQACAIGIIDATRRLPVVLIGPRGLAAVLFCCFATVGCDFPDRPPLPVAGRGASLDLGDIEAVRRAAGLPVQTEPEPIAVDPPKAMDRLYAIRTSPLAVGGSQTVGERRYRVDSRLSRQMSEQDWLVWEDESAADASLLFTESVSDDALQRVASECLWVRRNRCSVLVKSDVKESVQPDGSISSFAIRQQFGPLTRGVIGKVVDKPGGGKAMQIRSGFGTNADARDWTEKSYPWTTRDRGMLATADMVSNLVLGTNSTSSLPLGRDQSSPDQSSPDQSESNQTAPNQTASGPDAGGDEFSNSRLISVLVPDSNSDAMIGPAEKVFLQLVGQAAVPSMDSSAKTVSRPLYEVTSAILPSDDQAPSEVVREVYWVDDDGLIRRKLRGDGLLEVFSDTLEIEDLPTIPPGRAAIVVGGRSFDPVKPSTVAMRIRGYEGEFLAGPGQAFRRDEDSVEVLLTRSGKASDSFEVINRIVTSADTIATGLANYNQASMRRIAAATTSTRGRSVSRDFLEQDVFGDEIREGVDHRIARDAISVTKSRLQLRAGDPLFMPADKVIERGSGGPLARSIVLLTLLRGRGIASTLAMGVKANEPLGDENRWMGFHVWVIANLDGRWFTLDADDPAWTRENFQDVLPRTDRLLLATCDPIEKEIELAMSRTLDKMSQLSVDIVGIR